MTPKRGEVRIEVNVFITKEELEVIRRGSSDYRTAVVDAVNRGNYAIVRVVEG